MPGPESRNDESRNDESRSDPHAEARERALQSERAVQSEVDRKEAQKEIKSFAKPREEGPPQTGARPYPVPPFPEQHQRKPGIEARLQPAPMYDAPYWKGSDKLKGKVALITGADSGIGRAVAILFAREGADVAICHLGEDEDAQETKRAVEREGRRAILISGDVAEEGFAQDAVKRTLEALGGLDILVNNAAFQEHVNSLEELSEAHFDRTLKTNLYGYFHLAKAAVPHLKPGSAIIMTGSETGIFGSKQLLDYSMTKGGIHAFTRALAQMLLSRGVRVNAVAPGPVWTPLNPADRDAGHVAKFGADTGMKRPAQPEEIAPAFVFLASPQCSSFITGEILPILGGVTP